MQDAIETGNVVLANTRPPTSPALEVLFAVSSARTIEFRFVAGRRVARIIHTVAHHFQDEEAARLSRIATAALHGPSVCITRRCALLRFSATVCGCATRTILRHHARLPTTPTLAQVSYLFLVNFPIYLLIVSWPFYNDFPLTCTGADFLLQPKRDICITLRNTWRMYFLTKLHINFVWRIGKMNYLIINLVIF